VSNVRCFVAVSIPEQIRSELVNLIQQLQERLPVLKLKWTAPQNLHLTLRFLGSLPEDGLPLLAAQLYEGTHSARSFTLCTGGIGAFPQMRALRVLWVGVAGEELMTLQSHVERAVTALAPHQEEKPFHPHLTLARARSRPLGLSQEEIGVLQTWNLPSWTWEVNSFELMRSDTSPSGPVYSVLQSYALEVAT
jgi:2'-5' RNA ligase